MYSSALVSTQNHVESPFIIVTIGKYTFGHCEKSYKNKLQKHFNITYPNYMQRLNITKINGAINTYTLTMTYTITENDDPNRLEKVFSSISNIRKLTLSYGDWNAPSFIYKEEEAMIRKLTTKVDMSKSTIEYVISCTSTSLGLAGTSMAFPARKAKPSDVLFELLGNKRLGLLDLFTGMSQADLNMFIARDDKVVQLEAKPSMNVLDYMNYLVSCMVWIGDDSDRLKTSCYFWSVYDDTSGEYGGTYFKVIRVPMNVKTSLPYNAYELDVGYPTAACVTSFNINNDESWSLLYNYASDIELPEYSYHIDDSGQLVRDTSSSMTSSKLTYTTNEATRNWWSLVTQFPISATVTMKGLLRPTMLLSYVKINTYFYGHKHNSSGLYIIKKQEDVISNAGYRTTLTLLRVGSDEQYM